MTDQPQTTELTFARALGAFRAAKASGIDLCLITTGWNKNFFCSFERKEEGLEIRGSESRPDPAEAIVAAWEKFEGLARHGAPRMLAGLLEAPQPPAVQPKLAPAFIDLPSVDPDDEIPF